MEKLQNFVFFNKEDGKIISISNKENELRIDKILVDFEEVKHIIEGTETFDDFKIVFDEPLKKYIFKRTDSIKDPLIDYNIIYKVPTVKTNNIDIKILQDNVLGFWVITLTKNIFDIIKSNNTGLEFYITIENDANILVDTLKLMHIDFDDNRQAAYRKNSAFEKVSVFCRKVFDNYVHEKREYEN